MYAFRLKIAPSRYFCEVEEGFVNAVDCWKCHKTISFLKEKFFCPVCSTIQPVETRSFFDYLGVHRKFDIDLSLLKKNFHKFQSVVHPDKFSKCSQKEKEISEQCSQHLNEAYKTLIEPLQRAKYLLALNGEEISSEDRFDSASFLAEMMDINEQITSTSDVEKLKLLLDDVEERINVLIQEFSKNFEANKLKSAKKKVLKLTFYYRLKTVIADKLVCK